MLCLMSWLLNTRHSLWLVGAFGVSTSTCWKLHSDSVVVVVLPCYSCCYFIATPFASISAIYFFHLFGETKNVRVFCKFAMNFFRFFVSLKMQMRYVNWYLLCCDVFHLPLVLNTFKIDSNTQLKHAVNSDCVWG